VCWLRPDFYSGSINPKELTMKPPACRLLALSALLAFGPAAHAFDLTVEVLDARSSQGTVDGALYGAETTWLKTPLQGQRQPATDRAVLVYRNLPAGRYALALFHDENGNGKLDTNIVGIPQERFGFSRDARGRMGPPSFADAAIELREDTTISVNLH
jgi:uncharacterized protein (DUF2141 family)